MKEKKIGAEEVDMEAKGESLVKGWKIEVCQAGSVWAVNWETPFGRPFSKWLRAFGAAFTAFNGSEKKDQIPGRKSQQGYKQIK